MAIFSPYTELPFKEDKNNQYEHKMDLGCQHPSPFGLWSQTNDSNYDVVIRAYEGSISDY